MFTSEYSIVYITCGSGGVHQQPSAAPGVTDGAGEMKVQMAIVHPEIIVVEDAMTFDTNALILTVSLCVVVGLVVAW